MGDERNWLLRVRFSEIVFQKSVFRNPPFRRDAKMTEERASFYPTTGAINSADHAEL
jgi:hypothetical protein